MLETLVAPLKHGNASLAAAYESLLGGTEVRLLPITQNILREAAHLRATMNLKTPDALHAATAINTGCVQFITNDGGFRRISSLQIIVLKDLI